MFSVRITAKDAENLDAICRAMRKTRSEVLREALEFYVQTVLALRLLLDGGVRGR